MACLLIAAFLSVVVGEGGVGFALKITNIGVPSEVLSGESVRLTCHYLLQDDTLYSLTWWKDETHFYSYIPSRQEPQDTYEIVGFTVDKSRSTMHEVTLSSVDHRASGRYRCEVVADQPSYEKDTQSRNMTVIDRPSHGPRITGRMSGYKPGTLLLLNCSSPPSHPPSQLIWYINDQQASSTQTVITYPGEKDDLGRVGSRSGLQMWLTPNHFNRGLLLIRCDAHIEPTHTLSHKVTITSSDFIESSRMEHAQTGRGGARGGHHRTSDLFLVIATVTLTKLLGT